MDKTHHWPFVAPFPDEILKCLLSFFSYNGCVLSKQSFLFLLLLICCGYANYSAQGAFVIIFFTCSDLLNCLRSICNVAIRTRQHQSHLHEKKSSLQAAIFAVLMYSLYGHPRNFKFKQKNVNKTARFSRPSFRFLWLWLVWLAIHDYYNQRRSIMSKESFKNCLFIKSIFPFFEHQ